MKQIYKLSIAILALTFSVAASADITNWMKAYYNFRQGVEKYHENDYDEAFKYLSDEVNEHPKNGYAWLYLGSIYLDNDQYSEAVTSISKALKYIDTSDKQYRCAAFATQGDAYRALKDTVNSLKSYNSALKINSADTKIMLRRAGLYLMSDNYELAEKDYQRVVSIEPNNISGYLGLGEIDIQRDNYDGAIANAERAIAIDASDYQGYAQKARALVLKGDERAAIEPILSALVLDEGASSWNLLNMITDNDAKIVLAAKLKVLQNKSPNDSRWPYVIGRTYELGKQYEKALPQYAKGLKTEYPNIFYECIARCYFDLGQFEKALSIVDRALSVEDLAEDEDLIFLKGNILNEMGRRDEAIAQLDRYVDMKPDFYYGYYRRGWFKDEAGQLDEAIEDYTMAIILEPQYAYAYCGRGRCLMEQKKIDEARQDFLKVIELDTVPKYDSSAHYAFLFLGRIDEGNAFLDSLIVKEKDYYDAACYYSLLNDREKALEYLQKAMDAGYVRFEHLKVDRDLDNIRNLPEYKAIVERQQKKVAQFKDPLDITKLTEGLSHEEAESWDESDKRGKVKASHIPYTKQGGVMKVKCAINGLPLYFIFDTGAADVTMSLVEAQFMYKNGYIKRSDIVGKSYYSLADGNISEGMVINLRHVKFGGLELDDVRASVVLSQSAPLLLGQSVLSRLGKVEIDNRAHEIVITK